MGGTLFMGVLGYTDDVTLLSPTLTSLKIMLNIAEKFGKEFDVTFNVTKYQLLFYSSSGQNFDVFLYNNIFIKAQDFGNHLSNTNS